MSARRLGLALTAAATLGAAEPRESFHTIWLVEPAEAPAGEISVPPDGLVIRQRLLPVGLAVLDQAYAGAKPEDAIAAGTELIRVVGTDKAVFCALRTRANLLSTLLSPLPEKSMRCFIDDDADGRFDRETRGSSNVDALPHPLGRFPTTGPATLNLSYAKRDPRSFAGGYAVGVEFGGQAKIGTLRRFQTVYGVEKRWGYLTSDNIFTKRDRDLPKTLEVLGSSFTVLGGDGRNMRARVERTMPVQPFAVVSSVTYY